MENKRIIWADALKGYLILLVILGHSIQSVLQDGKFDNHIFNMIYSFHMPAFMAVSGWFAFKINRKHSGYIKSVVRRLNQLLVPYVIWSIIRWGTGGIYTIERLSNIILVPDMFFWFLWVLFWICSLFTLFQWIADKLSADEIFTVGAACIILMGIMVALDFRLLGFQFIAYYFLFYTLGYCVHRYSVLQVNNAFMLGVLCICWVALAWYWDMHELPEWMPSIPHMPLALLQYSYRGLTAALAIVVLLGIAPKAMNANNYVNLHIKNIGVISLGIYVFHMLIIGYVKDTILNILPNCSNWILIACTFVFTSIISIAVVKILMNNKWTARLLLGKV